MPEVSIIIPAYNRSKYIERAVYSVLNQTFSDLEVIVVDDASTDNTSELVRKIQSNDNRVKYIQLTNNKGAQHARNIGIKESDSTWIGFLDSDDEYLEESVASRLEQIKKDGNKVVYSACFVKYPEKEIELFKHPVFSGHIYKQILNCPAPTFPGLLVEKGALQHMGTLDEKLVAFQEWDTSIRLAEYYRFSYLSAPTFIYHCHLDEMISGDMKRELNGYKQIVFKHLFAILRNLGLSGLGHHFRALAMRYKKQEKMIQYIFFSFFVYFFASNQQLNNSQND